MADIKEHSDVLDISNSVDLDVDDDGAKNIARLKNKVKKRKGRGLDEQFQHQHEKIHGYESIPAEDDDKPGPQKSVEGWVLFVTSIHEEATEEDLHDKFCEFGEPKSININLDRRTGFLKGYALIEYKTFDQANSAREGLNGSELLGNAIGVDWCFVKGQKMNMKRKRSHRRVVKDMGGSGDHL